jgi:hypothetical protein
LLPTADDGGSDGSIADVAATVHDNVKQQHVEDTRTTSLKRKYQSNSSNDNETYELEIINPYYSTNDKKKSGNNERYIVNGIPTRNYIDLRMEQNRIFADDQSSKCRDILSTIKLLSDQSSDKERSSSYSISNNKNDDDNELEKHTKLLHSLLHEGLSACPNHVSLLQVQSNYAEWLQGNVEMLILDETIIDNTSSKSTLISSNKDTQHDSKINVTKCEGRAHAAMRDVLTERSFLTTHGGGGHNGDATTMVRGYSLLPTTDADDTIVMYGAAALGGGGDDELNRNESPPCNDHRQRRRKHDRKRRRSKDDRNRKRRRSKDDRNRKRSSSSLVHGRRRHHRRSQSCESSGSKRSEVSTSSSYTHSSSSSSSYSRRRRRQHRKEKKSRRSSKSKSKKSKKSKHHYRRKSRSCDTTGEEGKNDGKVVETLEERSR